MPPLRCWTRQALPLHSRSLSRSGCRPWQNRDISVLPSGNHNQRNINVRKVLNQHAGKSAKIRIGIDRSPKSCRSHFIGVHACRSRFVWGRRSARIHVPAELDIRCLFRRKPRHPRRHRRISFLQPTFHTAGKGYRAGLRIFDLEDRQSRSDRSPTIPASIRVRRTGRMVSLDSFDERAGSCP